MTFERTRAINLLNGMPPEDSRDRAHVNGLTAGWNFPHSTIQPGPSDVASAFRLGIDLRATSDRRIIPLITALPFRFMPRSSVQAWIENGQLTVRTPGSMARIYLKRAENYDHIFAPLLAGCDADHLPPVLIASDRETADRLFEFAGQSPSGTVRAVAALWQHSLAFRGERLSYLVADILSTFFAGPVSDRFGKWHEMAGARDMPEAVATIAQLGSRVSDEYADECYRRDGWRFQRLLNLVEAGMALDRYGVTSAAIELARQEQTAGAEFSILVTDPLWTQILVWGGEICTGVFDHEAGVMQLDQTRPPRVAVGRSATLRMISPEGVSTYRDVRIDEFHMEPGSLSVSFEKMRKKDGTLNKRWAIVAGTRMMLSDKYTKPEESMARESRVLSRLGRGDWVTGGIVPELPTTTIPDYLKQAVA